jgi:hypothetical protein
MLNTPVKLGLGKIWIEFSNEISSTDNTMSSDKSFC